MTVPISPREEQGMTDTVNPATTVAGYGPIPFGRLVSVEARKLFDTRTSKIVVAVLTLLTVAAIVARGLADGPEFTTLYATAGIGYGTLLPVIAILTVTGEWSHRTAMTTFALEPRRARVMAAKCLPPLVVAVVASLFALLVAGATTAVLAGVQGVTPDWDLSAAAVLGWIATGVLVVAQGLAVGMLLLNAPAAIVVCLTTTVVWALLSGPGAMGTLAGWLDLNATTAPLAQGDMTGADAARLAVAATFWIVLPMAAGVARVVRREVG